MRIAVVREAEAAEPRVAATPDTVKRMKALGDDVAIGLGAVFLHLNAKLNFHRLFNEAIENFSRGVVGERQAAAMAEVGLAAPH